MPISQITQPSIYSGINITFPGKEASVNISPFTNLKNLQVNSSTNNINSVVFDFNSMENLNNLSIESSNRVGGNPGGQFSVVGQNPSVKSYTVDDAVVTSIVFKNPTSYIPKPDLKISQVNTGFTNFNIEGNSLLGIDLTSILLSFSGMASVNNINSGYLNIIPYNNLGQIFIKQIAEDPSARYSDSWISSEGKYQLTSQINENFSAGSFGNIWVSTNYGIDWGKLIGGNTLGRDNNGRGFWTSVSASNDMRYIVATERSGKAYLSSNSGISFEIINTGLTNNQNVFYRDVSVSDNGQYINLSIFSSNEAGGEGTSYYPSGGLFLSNNYGVTFRKELVGRSSNYTRFQKMDMSSNGQYQFACINGGNQGALLGSSDYGNTWTTRIYGYTFFTDLFRDLAVSADGKYVTAVAERILKSANYGTNWSVYYHYTPFLNGSIYQSNIRGGVTVSQDGKNQIIGFDSLSAYRKITYENYPNYFYYLLYSTPGVLVVSTNYGNTWQTTSFTGNWGTLALSNDSKYLIAGERQGSLYTSITDGSDASYGNNLSTAFSAANYLRDKKSWLVSYIKNLFS